MRYRLPQYLRESWWVSLSLLASISIAAARADLPPGSDGSWYEELATTVVRLEQIGQAGAESKESRQSRGTGFFVQYERLLYLVTARHVIEKHGTMGARIPLPGEGETSPGVLELRIAPEGWVFHPGDHEASHHVARGEPDPVVVRPVDVAVVRLPWPPTGSLRPLHFCPRACDGRTDQLGEPDPSTLREVYVIGYPRYLGTELIAQRPLIRTGMVAMTATEPFIRYSYDRSYADPRMRVLDVRVFEGNSGGPVISRSAITRNASLLGLIAAGDDSLQVAYSEPVSRVREAILHADALRETPSGVQWLLE